MASMDENKTLPSKDYNDAYSNHLAFHAGKKGERLAEIGALTPVFENSVTELKQMQIYFNVKAQYK